MGMVKVLGYSNVFGIKCLNVVDSYGNEFLCNNFRCEFQKSSFFEDKLYYVLVGEYFLGTYHESIPFFSSYDPYEVLNECDRLRHLLDVFDDRVSTPQ